MQIRPKGLPENARYLDGPGCDAVLPVFVLEFLYYFQYLLSPQKNSNQIEILNYLKLHTLHFIYAVQIIQYK